MWMHAKYLMSQWSLTASLLFTKPGGSTSKVRNQYRFRSLHRRLKAFHNYEINADVLLSTAGLSSKPRFISNSLGQCRDRILPSQASNGHERTRISGVTVKVKTSIKFEKLMYFQE